VNARGDTSSPEAGRASLEAALAWGTGAVALAVYVCTLYPDLAGGDSGELITSVFRHGVSHPPGYPLYALLGSAFAHLPWGSVAWRYNLLSAVCDAAAASLVCAASSRWTRAPWAGVLAGALFAFSPVVWRMAVCAEVFALNNLMIALVLLLAVRYDEDPDPRTARATALAIGLGLSNHHTLVLAAAPLLAWMFWRGRPDLTRPRRLLELAAAFGLGLLPYVYLPLAAHGSSPVSWGRADTWSGFWTHVTRAEYGTFQLASDSAAAATSGWTTVASFGQSLWEALGPAGTLLAAAGLVTCLASPRLRPLGVALWVAPLLSMGVLAALGNLPADRGIYRDIVSRFWQEPLLFVCVGCGVGAAAVARRLPARSPWPLAVAALAAAVALPLARGSAMDRHRSTLVREYGEEIVRAAPPGALLLLHGDLISNSVWYALHVEGKRPDVRVVNQDLLAYGWYLAAVGARYPDVVFPGARYAADGDGGFSMKSLLDANVPHLRVLVCRGLIDSTADSSYELWPRGLCDEARPSGSPPGVMDWLSESDGALPRMQLAGQPHPPDSWEERVWLDYWECRGVRAGRLLEIAGVDPARRPLAALAAELFDDIVSRDPDVPAYIHKNRALAISREQDDSPAGRARAADAWKKYLAVGAADDADRPAIEREIQRLGQ
jgi:hypothetical protein